MRRFVLLVWLSVIVVLSFGCSGDGNDDASGGSGGSGGTGAAAGVGGGAGVGGMGGTVQTCVTRSNCEDQEPCTTNLCTDQVCEYVPLPDATVCLSDTGLSACLAGVCQTIWPSCDAPEAQDGDFCDPQPTPDPPRLGRCASGQCTVEACQVGFDCWNGDACQVGVCNSLDGTCSQDDAPDGTACIPPAGGRCFGGICGAGNGAGGQGGVAGQGGAGGQAGSGV